jgi:hypothetical protein
MGWSTGDEIFSGVDMKSFQFCKKLTAISRKAQNVPLEQKAA